MNRILHRALLAIASLMVVCAALLAWQVFDYWKLASLERQLTAGRSAIPAAALTSPEARLARAQVLIRRAGPGTNDAALDLYRAVEAEGSEPLRRIARYDTANLYLRQAQDEMVRGEPGRAIPLVELAKGIYRTLLEDDPGDWDLRYNLERAVRLLPEDDPEAGDVEQAAPENMENAPSTVRGTTMGLP